MDITTQLQAGQAQEYTERGDFFRLMDAGGPVNVLFYKNGALVAESEAVTEGYAEKFENGGFDKIRIQSATTITVHFVARLGNQISYDKPPNGDVTITNRRGVLNRINATIGWASATTIANANPARSVVAVQNNSATNSIRMRCDGVAPTQTAGLLIAPGGYWESPPLFAPSGAVSVIMVGASGTADIEGLEG